MFASLLLSIFLKVLYSETNIHPKYLRGVSTSEFSFTRQIEQQIAAVEWQSPDEWIHHDMYNIIDSFRLEYEDVEEARRLTMIKYRLTQI